MKKLALVALISVLPSMAMAYNRQDFEADVLVADGQYAADVAHYTAHFLKHGNSSGMINAESRAGFRYFTRLQRAHDRLLNATGEDVHYGNTAVEAVEITDKLFCIWHEQVN